MLASSYVKISPLCESGAKTGSADMLAPDPFPLQTSSRINLLASSPPEGFPSGGSRPRSVADIPLDDPESVRLLYSHYEDIVEIAENSAADSGFAGGFTGAWLLRMELDGLLERAPLTNYQRRIFTLHACQGLEAGAISRRVSTSERRVGEIVGECCVMLAETAGRKKGG